MPEGGRSLDLDAIHVLEGSTFMISDRRGDIPRGAIAGLFHDDTRFLSKYELRLNGERPEVLTSEQVDYYSAGFFLTNPELNGLPGRTVTIKRHRFVGDGLHDDVIVKNHGNDPVHLEVRLSFGVDFADLFEVKKKRVRKAGTFSTHHDPDERRLRFDYDHETFTASTRIRFTQPCRVEKADAVFDVDLEPRGEWQTCVLVALHADDDERVPLAEAHDFGKSERQAGQVLQKWQDEVPRLRAADVLEHVYRRSVVDLAALRLHSQVEGNEFSLPAAGMPWFMAIFGRDTLITSYQALWVGPELAKGALHSLASLQGTDENDFKDEDPGKILHEIRFGELTALGRKPHRPYYGTADATPLWLVLLSEYWRFTGDDDTVRELWPNALRALEWIDRYGDRDGDGYVEYRTRSSQGLRNQGWKDSWNGVMFHDGTVAEPPIALCEIQGYVYDAKVRAAGLAEHVAADPDLAARLRGEAKALFDRFNEDFWVEGRGRANGHYAIALDRDMRKVDSVTSNMGHLLWSGIVPEERAAGLVQRLMSAEMFSGWGVRTMSTEDVGYNPIAYHDGTVWPHDNSLISTGLARYGFREEANRIALELIEAAVQPAGLGDGCAVPVDPRDARAGRRGRQRRV